MTIRDIQELFDYDRWATGIQLDAVSELPDDLYWKDLHSIMGGLHGTLVHLYDAEDVWLSRWQGETRPTWRKGGDVPTFQALKSSWALLREEQSAFLASLTEAQLQAPWTYGDFDGRSYSLPLIQQMQHMVNHSTYHRGEVLTLLWQMGFEHPHIDLIVYFQERA